MPTLREFLVDHGGQVVNFSHVSETRYVGEDIISRLDQGHIITINYNSARIAETGKHTRLSKNSLDQEVISIGGKLYLRSAPGSMIDLGLELEQPDQVVETLGVNVPLPWSIRAFRLFGSHTTAGKNLVTDVKSHLEGFGIDLFVAHRDIDPSKEWQAEIVLALQTCHALAAFLTPDFHASFWTDQEVGMAMRGQVLIVPVELGDMPYGFLGRYQALRASALSPSEIASGIHEILAKQPSTSRLMPAASR